MSAYCAYMLKERRESTCSIKMIKYKLKKIFTNVRTNSSASIAGIQQPAPNAKPVSKERILEINSQQIKKVEDYYNFAETLKINQSIQIKTNQRLYRLTTREKFDTIELNETELKEIEETVKEVSETAKKVITVPKTKKVSKGVEDIGIRVFEVPKTNIKKGLDLQGGTRVLLQPEQYLNPNDLGGLMDSMRERLNVYGLADLVIRDASDLSGNQYILVEIAGATEDEIRNLLAREGKFEAKIGNKTVFRGGQEITFVCRSADCAGIDTNTGCNSFEGGSACGFRFSITLSQEAAQRQADATRNLDIIESGQGPYLSQKLELFLDDRKVDELSIAAGLKGEVATNIQISGSGAGTNEQEAIFNALNNMKRLQTVLITGSLPVR